MCMDVCNYTCMCVPIFSMDNSYKEEQCSWTCKTTLSQRPRAAYWTSKEPDEMPTPLLNHTVVANSCIQSMRHSQTVGIRRYASSSWTILYYTVLYYAIQCRSVLRCTVLWYTKLFCTVLYYPMLYCAVLYDANCTILSCNTLFHCIVLYWTMLSWIMLRCAVLYCTMLWYTAPCCNVLYCAVIYYAMLYCTATFPEYLRAEMHNGLCDKRWWTIRPPAPRRRIHRHLDPWAHDQHARARERPDCHTIAEFSDHPRWC